MAIGQIQLESNAGQAIFKVCLQDDVHTIVEIGTWNGMGSTKCVVDAIQGTNKSAISLEVDPGQYSQAIVNISSPNLKLIYGKITDNHTIIDTLPEIFFTDYSMEIKKSWLNQDLQNMSNAPNVLHLLPEQIDFLILDGGEFTTYEEYLVLKSRAKYIFLDDTTPPVFKNYYSRLDMITNHKTLIDNPQDRHGFYLGETICST